MPKRPKMEKPAWAAKEEPAKSEAPADAAAEPVPAIEEKRRGMTLRLPDEMRKSLGHLAVDLDVAMHDLVVEGIRMVLEKHRRK
jgi:hypothetical protein